MTITVEQFAEALKSVESGGDYEARNPDSGAYGAYQIMPTNWAPWAAEAGMTVPGWIRMIAPSYQDKLARFKLQQLFDRFGAWEDVAAVWYSGQPRDPATLDRPQGGGKYPTIREYVEKVMRRIPMAGSGTFAWTDYPVPVPPGSIGGRWKQIYNLGNGPYEHGGLDFPAPLNTEIRSWAGDAPGWVEWRKPGDGWGDGSLGVCAIINFEGTPYWAVLAHMTADSWEAGRKPLRNGALLGWVGMTGTTDGPHVHLGVSSEPMASYPTFAPMRQANGKLGPGTPLVDPMQFFAVGAPTPPAPPPQPSNLDLLHSLNNLNTAVIELREQFRAHEHGRIE